MILLTLFCANRLGPTFCWQLAARRDEGCSYRAPGMLVLYTCFHVRAWRLLPDFVPRSCPCPCP